MCEGLACTKQLDLSLWVAVWEPTGRSISVQQESPFLQPELILMKAAPQTNIKGGPILRGISQALYWMSAYQRWAKNQNPDEIPNLSL